MCFQQLLLAFKVENQLPGWLYYFHSAKFKRCNKTIIYLIMLNTLTLVHKIATSHSLTTQITVFHEHAKHFGWYNSFTKRDFISSPNAHLPIRHDSFPYQCYISYKLFNLCVNDSVTRTTRLLWFNMAVCRSLAIKNLQEACTWCQIYAAQLVDTFKANIFSVFSHTFSIARTWKKTCK